MTDWRSTNKLFLLCYNVMKPICLLLTGDSSQKRLLVLASYTVEVRYSIGQELGEINRSVPCRTSRVHSIINQGKRIFIFYTVSFKDSDLCICVKVLYM